ncbi:HD domain-containing protein [Streptomyces roseifaciens]
MSWPYVEHRLEVAEALVSGVGVREEDLLVAAVLHDVVEDTDPAAGEAGERFGHRVEEWVGWVTKPHLRPAFRGSRGSCGGA